MDHLRRLMDRTDAKFSVIHNFLFDRYRSVRQDLYVQGIEARPPPQNHPAPAPPPQPVHPAAGRVQGRTGVEHGVNDM